MIKDRRITYDRICDIMDEVEDKVVANKAIDIETLFDVLYILNEKRGQMEEKDEEDQNDDFFLATGLDTKIVDLADHITDIVKDEEEGRAFSMIGATFQTILEAIANAHVNGRIYLETKESSEYAIKLAETLARIMSEDKPEFNDGKEEDNE